MQHDFFEGVFYLIYPMLNFLLFVDLWWITKNPFLPQRKRNTYYSIPVLVIIFIELIVFGFEVNADDSNNQKLKYLLAIYSITNNILGLLSPLVMIWAFHLMRMQSGDEKLSALEIRVMIRYVISYAIFIPTILFNFFSWYKEIIDGNNKSTIDDKMLGIFIYFIILIPITRVFDQNILNAFQYELKNISCWRKNKKGRQRAKSRRESAQLSSRLTTMQNGSESSTMINRHMIAQSSYKYKPKNTKSSLITFLNSQFNTEYVNLILVSLTTLFSQDLASKNFENLIKLRGSTLV